MLVLTVVSLQCHHSSSDTLNLPNWSSEAAMEQTPDKSSWWTPGASVCSVELPGIWYGLVLEENVMNWDLLSSVKQTMVWLEVVAWRGEPRVGWYYPVSIYPHRPNAIYILLIIIPGQLRLYHFFCFLAPYRQLKIKWFPFHWSCWRLTGLVILKVRSLEMLSPRLLLVRFSLSGFYVMSIVSKPLWADVKRKNKKFF